MRNNHLGPLTAFVALPSLVLMASARADTITLPAMQMTKALSAISAKEHVQIAYATPAVKGLASRPVSKARTALDAVKAAIAGTTLAASGDNHYIMVYPKATNSLSSDITVVAHRSKAETSNVVDDNPSSNRSGLSLDDQPRSTTVITSAVIAQQQDMTALDALKNAAGVTVNPNTLQGSQTFSVRGFTSSGLVNGLSNGASGGITPGADLPVASLERIEVLKGPDAMLVGSDELGGTVNLVTKKPTADPLLDITGILGDYGDREASIDASDALTDDKRLSARIILEARKEDENWSGYRGDSEQLINPSLRWKDHDTDLTLTYLNSNQFSGLAPYVVYDDLTDSFLKRPLEPIGPRGQGISVQTNQFSYDLTRSLGKWVTLVSRGQYQHLVNQFSNYTPYAVIDTQGDLLVSPSAGSLNGNNANLDTYLRVKAPIVKGVKLTSSIGFSYNNNFYSNSVASQEDTIVIPTVDAPETETAIPPVDTRSLDLTTSQRGAYYQGVLDLWPVHLVGGVRYNNYVSTSNVYYPYKSSETSSADAFIPNVGAVWDITKHLSMFVNYADGYAPSLTTNYEGKLLPDIKTENLEGGFKAKFLNDKLSIISSIFRLKQSVTLAGDPLHPNFDIAEPGKQAIGSDTTIAGQILPGWTVNATLTYTDYRNLSTSIYGNAVDGSPRLQYSLYTTYIRKVAPKISVGGALGIYGRSNAAVDTTGAIVSPASNEVNLNGLATFGHLSFNLGVANIFNRRNYDISFTPTYISVSEPRLWHLTMSYSFF